MSTSFDTFAASDVRDLIAAYPLAWIVAVANGQASLLPLLGVYDEQGGLVELLGHMGRRNPLYATLTETPTATILVNGPHAYISPDQAGRRNWGPTWNYAQLTIAAAVRFVPDETGHSVEELTRAMEADRWSHHELGPRSARMLEAIIAFRARVDGITGRFKLGQDEPPEVFESICRHHPDRALVRWMQRFAR